jgi:hypothetical protein
MLPGKLAAGSTVDNRPWRQSMIYLTAPGIELRFHQPQYVSVARWRGRMMMTDHPVELDEHRGMAAQRSTEIRRRLHEVQADQAVLRGRHEEFERHAVAAPSTTWPEAAAKARYLIQLFARTPEAQDPRRRELIAQVLDELTRLSKQSQSKL